MGVGITPVGSVDILPALANYYCHGLRVQRVLEGGTRCKTLVVCRKNEFW